MIPKGLLIAILIGLSAGLALGLYLEKTYNGQAIKFVDGPSITIATEKSDYALGEPIKIEIINTGTVDVFFANSDPSLRVRALDGTEFYSISSDGAILAPKEKFAITWSQQKNDDSKVLEGRYVIESTAHNSNAKVHDSVTIDILR
ncbi:MAG: hypothetical protein FJ357_02305 [Thaumarchaeota archaeon]|nr:hypothetical protein [Nitrososphaerota archaeon]